MIKEGDKVICIENNKEALGKKFLVNETYIISSISMNEEVGVQVCIRKANSVTWFPIKDCFYKYFIPLAELREKQIKSVLDD